MGSGSLLDPKFSQKSDAALRFDQWPLDGHELGAFSAAALVGRASQRRSYDLHAFMQNSAIHAEFRCDDRQNRMHACMHAIVTGWLARAR